LFGPAEGWQRYQVAADGACGQEIDLPAPLGFTLATADWPRWPYAGRRPAYRRRRAGLPGGHDVCNWNWRIDPQGCRVL
jgi:hypothetical protein